LCAKQTEVKELSKGMTKKTNETYKNVTRLLQIVSVFLIISYYSSSKLAAASIGEFLSLEKQTIEGRIEGYREAKWEMSPDEVRQVFVGKSFTELEQSHTLVPIAGRPIIVQSEEQQVIGYFSFQDMILDTEVSILFYFLKNQLYKVYITVLLSGFEQSFKNTLARLLTEKYGPHTYSSNTELRWEDKSNHIITLDGYRVEYLDMNPINEITQLIQKKEKEREKAALEKL